MVRNNVKSQIFTRFIYHENQAWKKIQEYHQ